jgi:hypothetical protein
VTDDLPDLGPCCMCEGPGSRNLIMLSRRGAIPGHGWGCVVCGLPLDGAYAVLCEACIIRWEHDNSLLTVACRGWPGEGRIPIAELPKGLFDHDMAKHACDDLTH